MLRTVNNVHQIAAIDDVLDVNITAPVNGQVLTYDGGEWKNQSNSSTSIYDSDGNLTADRTVTQGTNDLVFQRTMGTGGTAIMASEASIAGLADGVGFYNLNNPANIRNAIFTGDASLAGGFGNQAVMATQALPLSDQAVIMTRNNGGVYEVGLSTFNLADQAFVTLGAGTINSTCTSTHTIGGSSVSLTPLATGNVKLTQADQFGAVTDSHIYVGSAGTDSIVLGQGATDNGNTNCVVLGKNITTTGLESVLIGNDIVSTTGPSVNVAIGKNCSVSFQSVSIGHSCTQTPISSRGVSIGYTANLNGNDSVAIGYNASCNDEDTIAIGSNSSCANQNDIAIGFNISATNEINIGNRFRCSNSGNYTLNGIATASNEEYVTVNSSGVLSTLPINVIDYDTVESDTNSPPTSSSVTLDKVLTICRNNDNGGFGSTWAVTLPNGTIDGQIKRLLVPRSGTTNTVSTTFSGQFSNGLSSVELGGTNQPQSITLMWNDTLSDWFRISGQGIFS